MCKVKRNMLITTQNIYLSIIAYAHRFFYMNERTPTPLKQQFHFNAINHLGQTSTLYKGLTVNDIIVIGIVCTIEFDLLAHTVSLACLVNNNVNLLLTILVMALPLKRVDVGSDLFQWEALKPVG